MRRAAMAACLAMIVACDNPTEPDVCAGTPPAGTIEVRITADRDTIVVGDSLRLLAEVSEVESVRNGGELCWVSYGGLIETPIEWSSSNPRVATASSRGLVGVVVGLERGNATITARATSLGSSATYNVAVLVPGGG
jgi:Bacterial Ig-like domain (group 2)